MPEPRRRTSAAAVRNRITIPSDDTGALQYLALVAYPDNVHARVELLRALPPWFARIHDKITASRDPAWSHIRGQRQRDVRRTLNRLVRRIETRLLAARIAAKALQPSRSVSAVAVDEMGDASNFLREVWRPSRRVIHLAMPLLHACAERCHVHADPVVRGRRFPLYELLSRPDWVPVALVSAERYLEMFKTLGSDVGLIGSLQVDALLLVERAAE